MLFGLPDSRIALSGVDRRNPRHAWDFVSVAIADSEIPASPQRLSACTVKTPERPVRSGSGALTDPDGMCAGRQRRFRRYTGCRGRFSFWYGVSGSLVSGGRRLRLRVLPADRLAPAANWCWRRWPMAEAPGRDLPYRGILMWGAGVARVLMQQTKANARANGRGPAVPRKRAPAKRESAPAPWVWSWRALFPLCPFDHGQPFHSTAPS